MHSIPYSHILRTLVPHLHPEIVRLILVVLVHCLKGDIPPERVVAVPTALDIELMGLSSGVRGGTV